MRWLFAVLALCIFAFADDHEHDGHESRHLIPIDIRYLDLNTSQKTMLSELIVNMRQELKKVKKEERVFEEKAVELFSDTHFEEKRYVETYLEYKKKIAYIQSGFLSNLHAILDVRQRKIFAKKVKEWEIE